MLDRRRFLGALGLPVAAAACAHADPARAAAAVGALAGDTRTPEQAALDEDLWAEVARAFTVDRSLINFNNGGVSPASAFVQDAMVRHLEFSHRAPSWALWRVLEPQREGVRQSMARHWGCSPEELAFTRNASESLNILQQGFDLAPGDEVLTSTQDYPRMISAFKQRERRDGVVMRQVPIPVPCEDDDEIVRRFEAAITPRTKLMLVCHVINLTGQVLPVTRLTALARRHGIPCLVDGAHGFAHLPFTFDELDVDFYGTSLHKWLAAPHGTGLLYVRRERIAEVWPLQAADETLDTDIRKFEQIGTHPAANTLAVAEALTFHQGLGDARKLARLVHLRDGWARPLLEHDRVRLHTSLEPGFAGAIATVQIEGIGAGPLASHLWRNHRILVTQIRHRVDEEGQPEDAFEGIRVSPSVYSTPDEVARFVDVMVGVVKGGLPG